jgi:hypothetical protein
MDIHSIRGHNRQPFRLATENNSGRRHRRRSSPYQAKYANTRSETTEGLVFVYSGRQLDDSTLMVFDTFNTSVNARYVIQLMRIQRRPSAKRRSIDPLDHTKLLLPPLHRLRHARSSRFYRSRYMKNRDSLWIRPCYLDLWGEGVPTSMSGG